MQFGLAVDKPSHLDAFQSASYNFIVFFILAQLVAASVPLLAFLTGFVDNWTIAEQYEKRKFEATLLLEGRLTVRQAPLNLPCRYLLLATLGRRRYLVYIV
jgi:hypothetical protein